MNTISPMKAWMKAATPDEQEALAARVGSSRQMLYFYSNGNRVASAERAGQIEEATTAMAKASKGRLPVVLRTDLAPACRGCKYAQKCLGERALASEFPIVVG
jgi:DNA-binding transcriptional regulator YdaS (Cro superfamily)